MQFNIAALNILIFLGVINIFNRLFNIKAVLA